ncbi:MAG: hypothetical protein WA052_00285 [Microgenomates group bacterium]
MCYENLDRTSGSSGVRGRHNLKSNTEFHPSHSLENRIIAEGITEDEALNLMSLTPEICRLTAAVDDIFGQLNEIDGDTENVMFFLFDAYERIINDRKFKEKVGITPTRKYLDVFVDVNSGTTGKYLVFRKLDTLFDVLPNGNIVNLKEAVLALGKEIMAVVLESQIAIWDKENN